MPRPARPAPRLPPLSRPATARTALGPLLVAGAVALAGCQDGPTSPSPFGDAAFREVGLGLFTARPMSDLWLAGDHAYTGTHASRGCVPRSPTDPCGDLLAVWDVRDPAEPVLLDTLRLDAGVVNDVKVSPDGSILVATHERSPDGLGGVSLFSLEDPGAPSLITRYTEGLVTGVHNVWIDRIGGTRYLFAVADGNLPPLSGLHVLDIDDPAAPREVATFWGGSSVAHDVYVRDGLAFLSHWDAGLIILDVGHGIRAGSPEHPVEVSRIVTPGGNVHNAWYWPARRLVFVGQEEGLLEGDEGLGSVHVVDVGDLEAPEAVASVYAPEATAHNVWLDEAAEVLFVGWYEAGLRAVDVSGVPRGELHEQGRVLAVTVPEGPRAPGNIWAPQLHRGHVWVSDRHNGLRSYVFER